MTMLGYSVTTQYYKTTEEKVVRRVKVEKGLNRRISTRIRKCKQLDKDDH